MGECTLVFRVRKEVSGGGRKEGPGEARLVSWVYSADKVDQHACNAEFHERRKRATG